MILWLLVSWQVGMSQSINSHQTITKDSVLIDLINPYFAPIALNMQALESSEPYIKVKSQAVLRYKDTLKNAVAILKNHITDTTKVIISSYVSFKANFGDPNDQPDDSLYVLPYPIGKRYKIIQGFGGKFSHNLKSSFHAIDFNTQIGDTITAARSGKVFLVKEDSQEHCRTRACANKGNKILILHADGTIANYVHLDFEGALVEVGDFVKAGQVLGISGMTGFTTTPHLHFVVHKAWGESVPVYFEGIGKKQLKQDKFYKRKK